MNLTSPRQGPKALKAMVTRAEAHAKRLGDRSTGAEHLLLAALEPPNHAARRAFEQAGGDPDAVAAAIADQHASALRVIGLESVPDDLLSAASPPARARLNESSVHVLRQAAVLAKADGARSLVVEVVAAVAGLEHGTAARTLRAMGVDRVALADAVRAEARVEGR